MLLGRLGIDMPGQVDAEQAWGMSVSGGEYWGLDGLAFVEFPLWGVSLGVALVGYYHRRRLLELPDLSTDASPVGHPQSAERHTSLSA
jgi:hypothetical protein